MTRREFSIALGGAAAAGLVSAKPRFYTIELFRSGEKRGGLLLEAIAGAHLPARLIVSECREHESGAMVEMAGRGDARLFEHRVYRSEPEAGQLEQVFARAGIFPWLRSVPSLTLGATATIDTPTGGTANAGPVTGGTPSGGMANGGMSTGRTRGCSPERQRGERAFLIPFDSLTAREKAWRALGADPEWESLARKFRVTEIGIYCGRIFEMSL